MIFSSTENDFHLIARNVFGRIENLVSFTLKNWKSIEYLDI